MLVLCAFVCINVNAQISSYDKNEPFGFCAMSSRTDAKSTYNITGGGGYVYHQKDGSVTDGKGNKVDASKIKVLKKGNVTKDDDIKNAIRNYSVVIFDGSDGDFTVNQQITIDGQGKTLLGINGARLCTNFVVSEEIRQVIAASGAHSASTSDGGGTLSNGTSVKEEAEFLTRQAIIDYTGDAKETYRKAGIFKLSSAARNIIIRNIKFVGPGSIDVGGYDLISSTGAKNVWVDHCDFTDGMDGNFDITNSADFHTVSWCTFSYTERSYMHQNTNLIGSSDSEAKGYLNTTFAYNIWGDGCKQRMPMARAGKIHMLNNYYCCVKAGTCMNPRANSEFLVEGNYYDPAIIQSKLISISSDALACTIADNNVASYDFPEGKGAVVTVPYAYTVNDATTMKDEAIAYAGATLKWDIADTEAGEEVGEEEETEEDDPVTGDDTEVKTIIRADITGGTSSKVSGTLAGTAKISISTSTDNGGYKFGVAGKYVGLTLADGNRYQKGDVVNVHTTKAAEMGDLTVYADAAGSKAIVSLGSEGALGDNRIVLPQEASSYSTIYIVRTSANSWNGYVDYIEVFRNAEGNAGDEGDSTGGNDGAPGGSTGGSGNDENQETEPLEKGASVTFDENIRYSKWVIDSRIYDFKANTSAAALARFDGDEKVKERSGKASGLDYVPGLVAKAVIEAADYYKDEAFAKEWYNSVADYANGCYGSVATGGGSLDDLNAVKMYFGVNELSKAGAKFEDETTYAQTLIAMERAVKGLKAHNDKYSISEETLKDAAGGWWHKSGYNNQMWCDGQYMGPALLAQLNNYGFAINEGGDWDMIAKQFSIAWNFLWNEETKLLYHCFTADPKDSASKDWAGISNEDPKVYHSAEYWGRAEGWYFLALVDVLEAMQKAGLEASSNYKTLKGYLNKVADGLKAKQDAESGCWYQLLNHDGSFKPKNDYAYSRYTSSDVANYLESSASAIFTAAYLKGMRLGLYDEDYTDVAKRGYKGVVEQFMKADGNGGVHLMRCCKSAGLGGSNRRDGSALYYLVGSDTKPTSADPSSGDFYTEGKVLGAFILAATEYERRFLDDENGDVESGIHSIINNKTNNGRAYNIAGQRVGRDHKGLIIKDGKKVYNY